MARTRNNQLIGAAAAAQKRDNLETIMTADAIARARLRKRTMQACQYIADRIPPADYEAWWKTAPDDNEGFYRAAADKMSELEAAEVLEWLSPADYDATDPAARRLSEEITAHIATIWDTIPEIPL